MEKVYNHQVQLWRIVRSKLLSYKNATLFICILNIITALLLLHGFFASPSSKFAPSVKGSTLYRHIKESEDIRRTMVPVDLIKRVREIGQEVSLNSEPDQPKDVKQTAAVDLISRLNNFRSYSDAGNLKAIEDWRRRKMERARKRNSGRNDTAST